MGERRRPRSGAMRLQTWPRSDSSNAIRPTGYFLAQWVRVIAVEVEWPSTGIPVVMTFESAADWFLLHPVLSGPPDRFTLSSMRINQPTRLCGLLFAALCLLTSGS